MSTVAKIAGLLFALFIMFHWLTSGLDEVTEPYDLDKGSQEIHSP